jgi:glycosyltransferase involved in cell wall biosynthesis
MASQKSKPRFFIASGCPIGTTTRYRCLHLQEQLHYLGYESEFREWFEERAIDPAVAHGYDAFFLYRLTMSTPLEHLIRQARELDKPTIFDVDDLVFEPELVDWHRGVKYLDPPQQTAHIEGMRRYQAALCACDAVTVATPVLAQLAGKFKRTVYVHRNSLGQEMLELAADLYQRRSSSRPNERIVIGYGSGTPTHEVDFEEAVAALTDILHRYPQAELWIAGPLIIPQELSNFGQRIRRFPLSDWRGWFELLGQMDIALAPLEMGNIFCRAKSEIKFVEAAALGVPVVASDIDPFQDSITEEHDGLLAADAGEWHRALTLLIENPEYRVQMGKNARQKVLQSYSLETRAKELEAILPSLMNKGGA